MEQVDLYYDGVVYPVHSLTWEAVIETSKQFNNLKVEPNSVDFYVTYKDEEEQIVVKSQSDLNEALLWAREKNVYLCLTIPYDSSDCDSEWSFPDIPSPEHRPRDVTDQTHEQMIPEVNQIVSEELVVETPTQEPNVEDEIQKELESLKVMEDDEEEEEEVFDARSVCAQNFSEDDIEKFRSKVMNEEYHEELNDPFKRIVELLSKTEDVQALYHCYLQNPVLETNHVLSSIFNPKEPAALEIAQGQLLKYHEEFLRYFQASPKAEMVVFEVLNHLKQQKNRFVHQNIYCNGCESDFYFAAKSREEGCRNENAYIVGARYRSITQPDFDICETCERTMRFQASGPFVKVVDLKSSMEVEAFLSRSNLPSSSTSRDVVAPSEPQEVASELANDVIDVLALKNSKCQHLLKSFTTSHAGFACDICKVKAAVNSPMFGCRTCNFDVCSTCMVPAIPVIPEEEEEAQAKFVADITIPDGAEVKPEEAIEKIWSIKNSGKKKWPPGTRLYHVGGDLLGGSKDGYEVPLAEAGETVRVRAFLRTPSQQGRYTSYWRMKSPDGTIFGHRFWVTFKVVVPKDPLAFLSNSTVNFNRSIFESGSSPRTQGFRGVVLGQPNSSPIISTSPPLPIRFPGVVLTGPPSSNVDLTNFDEAVARITDAGFTDVEKILVVLKENNGDVQRTIEKLLDQSN